MPAARLTYGLRWPDDPVARHRLITDVLQGRCAEVEPSRTTVEAEDGLDIADRPSYFFVMRTEQAFGRAVFVYTDNGTSDQTGEGGGATPFDSGGLWHGHLCTEPPIGRDQRLDLFRAANASLADWQRDFGDYVRINYSRLEEYVLGSSPKQGTPPIVPRSPPNSARAWTWEVRVPRDLVGVRLRLVSGAMLRTDYYDYLDWLWRESPVEDRDAGQIQGWAAKNLILSDKEARSPSELIEADLLGERP